MDHLEGNTTPLAALLEAHRVLGLLPPATRDTLARTLKVQLADDGERLAGDQPLASALYWLIEGECALLDAAGDTVLLLRAGELFGANHGGATGVLAAQARGKVRFTGIDAATVQGWREDSPALAYLLGNGSSGTRAPDPGLPGGDPALNLMSTPVRALIRREPITLAPETSIRDAARIMSEQRVSSVLIVEQGLLFGLITDRDLRNRVIAAGLDGVEKGLKLTAPPITGTNQGAENIPRAPRSLLRSTHNFKQSSIARDWLGDTFVDHFAATREWEHRQWQDAVTDWELKRYFEII